MALQGSLDDFALPDVLALLASTKKTGELHVSGERGGGRLWLRAGEVVWAEAGEATDTADCVFELLRATGGQFRFTSDVTPPDETSPQPVEPLLAEATARLAEWAGIEQVVPSLAAVVRLEPEPPAPEVVVSAEQWRALVAVAEGGTVAAVARALGTGEFGACRAVKELVDAGLVAVATGPRPGLDSLVEIPRRPRQEEAERPEPAGLQAPSAPDDTGSPESLVRQLSVLSREDDEAEDAAGTPVGEEQDAEAAPPEALVDENGEPINRSLLLKFLSSVRS